MPEITKTLGYAAGGSVNPPPAFRPAAPLQNPTLDNRTIRRDMLDTLRDVFGLALLQLDAFTESSQNRPFPNSRETSERIGNCRRSVTIGIDGSGKPIVQWACGRTEDEVNDSIVRIYLASGLIGRLFPAQAATVSEPAAGTREEERTRKAENDGVSFGAYVQNWMERYKGSLKPTTLKGYRSYLRRHLLPTFGTMNLLEISVDDIQDFLNERKGLSHKTLREFLVFLRQIFDSAVEDRILPFNPAKSKRLQNPSSKVTVREALPLEVVLQILRDVGTLPAEERRLMALLLLTGMRRGEMLGLKWEDIDFEKKMISVCRNVTYPTNQPNLTTPKTKNGMRNIPADENLILLLDRPDKADGYIVGGDTPVTLAQYNALYARIDKQVNLHDATAHIFRHSYLTLLDAAGVDPKTLQVIAGHGDIRITMNRYVHGREQEIAQASSKLNSLMNQPLHEPDPA